jgi:hypothetical protein
LFTSQVDDGQGQRLCDGPQSIQVSSKSKVATDASQTVLQKDLTHLVQLVSVETTRSIAKRHRTLNQGTHGECPNMARNSTGLSCNTQTGGIEDKGRKI